MLSLNNNRIEDPSVVQIFYQMAELRVLNLMGNPLCGKVRYYRKTLTGTLIFNFLWVIHLSIFNLITSKRFQKEIKNL